MIFALADYVRYRLRKGRYNPAVLEAQGWILGTPGNFAGERVPAPGLICIVHTQGSFVSWVIMYASRWRTPASHTFLFGEDGMIVDVIPRAGVIERPLSDYLDGRSYFAVAPKDIPPPETRMEALAEMKSHIGARYGWSQAARKGAGVLYGRREGEPAHWRLWTDVVIVLPISSVPRRWISWWPDLLVRIGPRYLRTLILNRLPLDVERPSEALVKAFEPMLARRGIRVLRQPKWPEIQRMKSHRE
jgi:hypothetical protein